jgi:hypothetical protein
MDALDAARTAKTFAKAILAEEHVNDIRVEEVEPDESNQKVWYVTVSFRRPTDPEDGENPAFDFIRTNRIVKVVKLSSTVKGEYWEGLSMSKPPQVPF